jgi:hypothetical protein
MCLIDGSVLNSHVRFAKVFIEVYSVARVFWELACCLHERIERQIRRGADKSLAFPISYFPVCSTTKIIFLGCVKEVRTTKS